MEATILLDGSRTRSFADALNRAKDGSVNIADFTAAPAITSSTLNAGATVIPIDSKPAWLVGGITCALLTGRNSITVQVDFVDGNTVGLVLPLPSAVGAGSQLLPLVPGSIGNSTMLSHATVAVATTNLRIDVEPGFVVRNSDNLPFNTAGGGETAQVIGPAGLLLGRYVLLRKPNFLNRPQVQFNIPFQKVDYGRGKTKTFAPVAMVSRTLTATHLAMSRAEALAILDIFLRCKGRAGEIYVPTWGDDLPAVKLASGDVLRVTGSDFYDTYLDDPAHAAVLIRTKDGKLYPREFRGMARSGADTDIFLSSNVNIPAANIDGVSWMFVARFAQDTMTVEWVTTEVANIALSFVTLANLAAESGFGTNWILDTGYWRDRGEWVDSEVWRD
ncbi:hypothetical protein [Rhizobium wenxiniae]|uniref:hypothetical protein n=1 Tax=Rhizobium wenxiniae TaxID=1737357 RepID=UPI003C17B3EF